MVQYCTEGSVAQGMRTECQERAEPTGTCRAVALRSRAPGTGLAPRPPKVSAAVVADGLLSGTTTRTGVPPIRRFQWVPPVRRFSCWIRKRVEPTANCG